MKTEEQIYDELVNPVYKALKRNKITEFQEDGFGGPGYIHVMFSLPCEADRKAWIDASHHFEYDEGASYSISFDLQPEVITDWDGDQEIETGRILTDVISPIFSTPGEAMKFYKKYKDSCRHELLRVQKRNEDISIVWRHEGF